MELISPEIFKAVFFGLVALVIVIGVAAAYVLNKFFKLLQDERAFSRKAEVRTIAAIEQMTAVLRQNLEGHISMKNEMIIAKARYEDANKKLDIIVENVTK